MLNDPPTQMNILRPNEARIIHTDRQQYIASKHDGAVAEWHAEPSHQLAPQVSTLCPPHQKIERLIVLINPEGPATQHAHILMRLHESNLMAESKGHGDIIRVQNGNQIPSRGFDRSIP
jgi:hypothetical protein